MPEKPPDYYEEDEVLPSPDKSPERTEQRETMETFLSRLRETTAELQRKIRVERPRSSREGEVFKGISTEKLEEQAREREERRAETIWATIKEEGFNTRNLSELIRNVEVLSLPELQTMIATIDDLLMEWDPTTKWFLQDLKKELQAMARLREIPPEEQYK